MFINQGFIYNNLYLCLDSMCLLRTSCVLNFLEHRLHENPWSISWIFFMCRFKLSFLLNTASQSEHWNFGTSFPGGRKSTLILMGSSWTVLMCLLRFLLVENTKSQWWLGNSGIHFFHALFLCALRDFVDFCIVFHNHYMKTSQPLFHAFPYGTPNHSCSCKICHRFCTYTLIQCLDGFCFHGFSFYFYLQAKKNKKNMFSDLYSVKSRLLPWTPLN